VGRIFEDLPDNRTKRAVVLGTAEETFRICYAIVEEILSVEEGGEEGQQDEGRV